MDFHAQRESAPPVLVVDDNTDIRETVRLMLEDEGYTVLEAPDGQEALKYLRSSAERLIVLLDHIMPGMDGMQTLVTIADEPALTRRHTYIMLTADGRTGPTHLMSDGDEWIVPVLAKPFDLDDLLAAVARARGDLLAVSYHRTGEP
ncbi:MAG TPA: response regulator [Ktedonobacterales bacterium]|nr:response regulator [Ktedonobacterales bacterium]